ncbi:MAG TPA: ABC transporter substrate-binding protein [Chloroflexota bacterium]
MLTLLSRVSWVIVTVTLLGGCSARSAGETTSSIPAAGEKPSIRVVAGIRGEPVSLNQAIVSVSGSTPGSEALAAMVHGGLGMSDHKGILHPQFAEQVPSVENGLWRVFPDGRMETTWHINPQVRWHDGQAFTTDDLVFTAAVYQDDDLPAFSDPAYRFIEDIQPVDSHTITVRWKRPFVQADDMWSFASFNAPLPLPRHILERPYTDSKTSFMDHAYFGEEFVGAGAYRLREFARGIHAVFVANPDYVLGRPKIDEIEVKFILDGSALVANLLSGTVEVNLGRGLTVEQALQVRDQLAGSHMEMTSGNWIAIYPQHIDANPAIVTNVQFRQALLYATDRQALADTLVYGTSPVAHSWLPPGDGYYDAVASSIVRYDYDPSRAVRMIETLGYAKGADGFFRDAAGQRLSVELRATQSDINQKSVVAVADFWTKASVGVDQVSVPSQRAGDIEYRTTFPAFELARQPADVTRFKALHSTAIPLPETRFAGENRMRYTNPELDALVDKAFTTIAIRERSDTFAAIVRYLTEHALPLGMFYDGEPTVWTNRLHNVTPRSNRSTQTWNVQTWEVDSQGRL